MNGKVWLILGTGKGTRLKLVKSLLGEGYRVAVTLGKNDMKEDWLHFYPSTQLLQIDIKDYTNQSRQVFNMVVDHFGPISEVVNNHRLWIGRR